MGPQPTAMEESSVSLRFRVLSDDQAEAIFLGALQVLERTGTRVESREAIDLLAGAGAWVDGRRVRLPAGLVERALRPGAPCWWDVTAGC